MRDINRRINTIEKKLRLGRHQEPAFPTIVVALQLGREMTDEEQQELGAVETWITYQEQLQAGEKANAEYLKENPGGLPEIVIIELDVDKEHQAGQRKATKNNPKLKNYE